MSGEFLTHDQVATYGRFAGPPSKSELERHFFLDDVDRQLVDRHRRDHNRLGFGLQLGTVRFLGSFLPNPLDVPIEVVVYLADQLGITDPVCLEAYVEREMTPYEHAWEIRREYGYRDFAEAAEELREFLNARAWTTNDGSGALFDQATAWLIRQKVLLPGATALSRLVTAVRTETAERLWQAIVASAGIEQRARLIRLLDVEEGLRFSALERLRTAPTRVSGPEMARALERAAELLRLDVGGIDTSRVPANRLAALARYGLTAKAPQLRQLTEPRRTATLLATLQRLQKIAVDDALDLLEVLMTTKLLARAERESAKERLRMLPRFTRASAKLAAAIQILLGVADADAALSVSEVWVEIERIVPRSEVAAALAAVLELATPADGEADELWRAELVKRYPTVRPFLPLLIEVIDFGAVRRAGASRRGSAAAGVGGSQEGPRGRSWQGTRDQGLATSGV